MRSRFFGASSYDDEDEEETQDFSGFITSSETQPVVVERKRASSSKTEASNMGNAGPKTTAPPPPMTDMGYRPHLRSPVEFKDSGAGSPWNPLWASDDALLKKPAVISKTVGAAGIIAGVAYAIGQRVLEAEQERSLPQAPPCTSTPHWAGITVRSIKWCKTKEPSFS